MIILIGGEKGGTGKTTLSTNLAIKLMDEGQDILIVDTDKQGSASAWVASRESNSYQHVPCVQKFGKGIPEQIKDLANRYKYVIIDAGGRDSIELRASMMVADILLIPIQASQFDVWTLGNMDELVKQAKAFNTNLNAKIIMNRASPNPMVNEIEEARSIVSDFDEIQLSDVVIRDRIAFRKAAKSGLAVFELADKDYKAINEINSLYDEIFSNEAA